MSYCGTAVGYTKDCDFPMHGGTEQEVMLIDFEFVRAELALAAPKITFDTTTLNLITAFTFTPASGRLGYVVESNLNQVKPSSIAVRLNSGLFFTNALTLHLPDNTAAADSFVKNWSNKRVVAIFKNLSKSEDGAAKYKVIGLDNGLIMGEASQNPYEENGVWVLNFASDENAPEKYPYYTIFKTDEATTDAFWTALKIIPPVS